MVRKSQEDSNQQGLFQAAAHSTSANLTHDTTKPLAYRARPSDFDGYKGQQHVFNRYPFLREKNFGSLILWGPPGTGKTTLAQVLSNDSNKELYHFSAVLGGVNDLKKLIASAKEMKDFFNKEPVIFVDEIHRFNKAQQDALLPYVEAGEFILIGATTENPKVSVNRALLSRVQVIELKKLHTEDIFEILDAANTRFNIGAGQDVLEYIAEFANGDARNALNILEAVEREHGDITLESVCALIFENNRDYDKNKDRHYDVISAFIKSLRGSDPNAALLWLAVMIDGGEDPVFIARRLVVFASEDVGNADPTALSLAAATLTAVQNIGMPEARINLGQCTTYLASTVKSNAAYTAIDAALDYVRNNPTIDVPTHLRNQNEDISNYKYPHAFPHHFVKQNYTVNPIPKFYEPTEMGTEKKIKERLENLWND